MFHQAVTEPHGDGAVDLSLVGQRIQDRAGVMRGGKLGHAHLAGLVIDLDVSDLSDQGRLGPIRHIRVMTFDQNRAAIGARDFAVGHTPLGPSMGDAAVEQQEFVRTGLHRHAGNLENLRARPLRRV